jgi:hypothetical protein
LCRALHSEQEKKDQTAVKKPAATTQNWKAKHLSGAQLARTEEPLAAKTKTHQWTEQEPLEPRAVQCVEGEDQTEHTGTGGEQMAYEQRKIQPVTRKLQLLVNQ